MPWATTRTPGTNPKYRTPEHRAAVKAAKREHQRAGSVECAQPMCVMPSRTIWWGEPTHLGHDDTGTIYIGLVHPACNVKDGARRGNARAKSKSNSRWEL